VDILTAPNNIIELVERFDRNLETYKQGKYNETQLRREFIAPFFEELGWDVANKKGYAEAYKDVIHEDAIKVGGTTKAPDYCFRIGGTRKFFLEAKKPSVNVKEDTHPAFQLRRYAWSAGLPLSILTDFEEFAVYDCRVKPVKTDKATHSRVLYITYTDYPARWDEISAIFSHEAILKGSFDKYVESKKAKRGEAEVDVAFLKEIERWRELLARNIALRSPALTKRELNFAIQSTIDRIIFLRICEDRGVERYGSLMGLLNGEHVYKRLFKLFYRADERYNSGLFHFRREKERPDVDSLTPELTIDDRALKDILKNLYYPDSPYEFSVLPADILGHVYEQFLGKVIRLTPSHRAIVEDKPEVRKAGGVYYTPTYIVDYIVKQTVGKLIEGKKPGPRGAVSKIKILDPACGSGSFLLGAYQYLLDWHRDEYINDDPRKWARGRTPRLYQSANGEWKLTIDERKRILLNNIFGVDVDPQAVEVTKLSLLLKVMEGEDEQAINRQLSLFQERILPDLDNNIKCGNSLIGPDFYKEQQKVLFDEEETYRINVFDWEREFPEIMNNGGFDAVIGNPPWISLTGKFGTCIYPKCEIEYLIRKFAGNTYMPNMYEYFVAKGINLLAVNGYFGYIVPDRLGFNSQFVGLRRRILDETQIVSLVYKAPFPGITADTLIFILSRTTRAHSKSFVEIGEYGREPIRIPQLEFEQDTTYSFHYYDSVDALNLIKKIERLPDTAPLGSIFESTSGFGGKSKLITYTKVNPSQIEVIKGDSITRYTLEKSYWFDFKKENITGRTTNRTKLGARPKILLRKTGDRILATFDDTGIFPEQSLYFLFDNKSALDFKYLLGILNSALVTFYYRNRLITNRRSIAQLKKVHLDELPIRTIDSSDPTDKARHDQMVELVRRMLNLHKQLIKAKTPQSKTVLQRQIEATDRQIDELVYKLYGLTKEEIKIVEKGLE